MSFDPHECLDCPLTALQALVWILAGVLAVGFAVWLAGRRPRGLPIVPALVGTLAVFCYLLGTFTIFKFGIVYVFSAWDLPNDFRSWRVSRYADLAVLASWYALTAWTWRVVRRRRRAA
jgi:hypothetical protein